MRIKPSLPRPPSLTALFNGRSAAARGKPVRYHCRRSAGHWQLYGEYSNACSAPVRPRDVLLGDPMNADLAERLAVVWLSHHHDDARVVALRERVAMRIRQMLGTGQCFTLHASELESCLTPSWAGTDGARQASLARFSAAMPGFHL